MVNENSIPSRLLFEECLGFSVDIRQGRRDSGVTPLVGDLEQRLLWLQNPAKLRWSVLSSALAWARWRGIPAVAHVTGPWVRWRGWSAVAHVTGPWVRWRGWSAVAHVTGPWVRRCGRPAVAHVTGPWVRWRGWSAVTLVPDGLPSQADEHHPSKALVVRRQYLPVETVHQAQELSHTGRLFFFFLVWQRKHYSR